MALRAGYKGFKKLISPLILNRPGTIEIDGDALNAELNEVFFPRSEQAVLGAKNLFKVTATNHTKNDVVFTIDDGVVELSGTSTGDINVGSDNGTLGTISGLTAGEKYILSGCPEGGSGDTYRLVIRNDITTSEYYTDTGNGVEFTAKNVTYTVYIRANSGINLTGKIFKAMIRIASDTVPAYAPYAKTNKQLTDDVAILNDSASDQKTAINAIITAATEAADFAAFKAAMEAITPVTRSLAAPEATREVIEEEPVTVKKTTRKKSTAAADTEKEGE